MNSVEYRELRQLIERRHASLDKRLDALGDRLEHRIEAAAAETRAHFDRVAEKFREDVKKIGEGYEHHTSVLDDHETRLQRIEQARLKFD